MSATLVPVASVRPGWRLESRCGVAEVLAVDVTGHDVLVTFSHGDGVAAMELPDCALVTRVLL